MKLVDEHEKCEGNVRGELAFDTIGLRSLVGLANYYHHFIQVFSKVARTLLRKWLFQKWDEHCHQIFG